MQSQSQEVQEDWKPSFLPNEEFTHLMLEVVYSILPTQLLRSGGAKRNIDEVLRKSILIHWF